MRFSHYLKRAWEMPPRVTAQKAWRKASGAWRASRERARDLARPTYGLDLCAEGWTLTVPLLDLGPVLALLPAEAVREKSVRVLAHEFDLLGSGLVPLAHGTPCEGLEGVRFEPGPKVAADPEGLWLRDRINPNNLPESGRIWGLIYSGQFKTQNSKFKIDYEPIDWQLDFKSGFRWDERTLSRDITYGDVRGADVKVPWELGRMQHLPCLAWAYGLSREGREGFQPPEAYAREFRGQVLDFAATNPPRYGVQWSCTMDVAIRAANWVLAYRLFLSLGASFDREFQVIFARCVAEHADHIYRHLEWDPHLRSNHYLADIAGLLWASLPMVGQGRPSQAGEWLAFACDEFAKEAVSQFHEEGSNFEGSTSYHRLSAEMVVHTAALRLGSGGEGPGAWERMFPEAFRTRFPRIARFTLEASLTEGRMAQVGDNDSGRFFKLLPLEENSLDHRHLVAAFNGLLDRPELVGSSKGFEAESLWIRALAGGRKADPAWEGPVQGNADHPAFGLYRRRKGGWSLIVRCGPLGQKGNGGHAHNDQLSFELAVKGVPLVLDPGTFLYTPLPEERNLFRSTASHNVLTLPGREQNSWEEGPAGLFRMTDLSKAAVLPGEGRGFTGEHRGFGFPLRRTLDLKEGRLEGREECPDPGEKAVHFHLAPGCQVQLYPPEEARVSRGDAYVKFSSTDGRWDLEMGAYSGAYGEKEPAPVLVLRTKAQAIAWKIQDLE